MSVDQRLNCAAEICCGGGGGGPMRATVSLLIDFGCPEDYAGRVAKGMKEAGVVFLSAQLAEAISEIVQHPGRTSDEGV